MQLFYRGANDVFIDFFRELERVQVEGPNKVATGISVLDDFLNGGFGRTDMVVLAARPSIGKSAWLTQIACNNVLRQNNCVAIFSLEMSAEQVALRMCSQTTGIAGNAIARAQMNNHEWSRVAGFCGRIGDSKLFIDDMAIASMQYISESCRQINETQLLDMVLIDYLQLVTGDKSQNRVQEVSEISRQCKILAKSINCPVVALSQLNRGVENRDDKRPRLSDLRDSGAIEQDADLVLMLYRDQYYNPQSLDDDFECLVVKNRHGAVGTVRVPWNKYTTHVGLREEVINLRQPLPGILSDVIVAP